MASKGIELSLALTLLSILWSGAMAQSSCTTALVGLSPCLNYITGNSSTPSSSCCSQLANTVQSQPQCLCTLLNGGGSSLGLSINQTLALALPGACNVQTPPVSQCNGAGAPPTAATPPVSSATPPVSSPAGSPSGASNQTPDTQEPSNIPGTGAGAGAGAGAGGGAGSKTVPSTQGNSSAGSTTKFSLHLVLFLVFTATTALRF